MDVHDDRTFEELCTRRLDHAAFPRVYLDATYVKTRRDPSVAFEAIVAATGARSDGGLEILGVDVGDSEDAEFWRRFLFTLRVRGLAGVRILGSDEHGGLEEALADVFPEARWAYSPGSSPPVPAAARRRETRGARHAPPPAMPRQTGYWAVPGRDSRTVSRAHHAERVKEDSRGR